MPSERGPLLSTINMRNAIHEALKHRPMSVKGLSEELGYPERTIYNRIQDLIKEGVVKIVDKENNRMRYSATEKTIIPQMPTPVGYVPPGQIINQIASSMDRRMSRLEIMARRWDYAFVSIFRNAQVAIKEGKFDEEKAADLKRYLNQFKTELEIRLRVVNWLIAADQFWNLEGLQEFAIDAAWPHMQIDRAWEKVLLWESPTGEQNAAN